jgi:hypothetical protein
LGFEPREPNAFAINFASVVSKVAPVERELKWGASKTPDLRDPGPSLGAGLAENWHLELLLACSKKIIEKKPKYVLPDGGAFVYSPPPVLAQRFKPMVRTTIRKLREGS